MKFSNILDDILGHKPKIKLLRYLLSTDLELTGRQLSRTVGIHHRTCHLALKELASFGIIIMNQTGKAIIYKINRNNLLVKKILRPIFELEQKLLSEAVSSLLKNIRIRVVSAIVFGSIASATERGTSDLDVLFLVLTKEKRDALARQIEEEEYNFILKYGNKLSPLVFTIGEFSKRLKQKDRLARNIIQQGKSVYGKTIQEVLIECRRN